jgi:excisionase family DNA binding protein
MSDRLEAALVELAAAIRAEIPVRSDTEPERLYSVDEACQVIGGIGRSLLYTEMQAGRLGVLHVGRRVLIPASAIRDYIASR